MFQILSYLRAGSRGKKKKKDKLGNLPTTSHADNDSKNASGSGAKIDDIPLYDDVGDYVPSLKRDDKRRNDDSRRHRDRGGDRERNRDRDRKDEDRSRRTYFDKSATEEEQQKSGFSNQDKEM